MNSRVRTSNCLTNKWLLAAVAVSLGDCAASQPSVLTQQSTRTSDSEIHARIKAANPGYSGTGKVIKDNHGVIWGLDIHMSNITSLEPLRGMQLTALMCSNNSIEDLSPLRGMKLLQLGLTGNPVSDLSPLSGMPLWKLWINKTKVADLRPLTGMKLEEFSFSPENITEGIDAVRSMKSITNFPMPKYPNNPTIGSSVTKKVVAATFWDLYERRRCPDGTVAVDGPCADGCAGGGVLSNGHCCWPGQAWEASKATCDGNTTCPKGTAWDGNKCARYTIIDNDLTRDNKTGLVWLRRSYWPRSQPRAIEFCKGREMRIPTKEEALEIADSNYDGTVFVEWSTWTSSSTRDGYAAIISFSGITSGLKVGLASATPTDAVQTSSVPIAETSAALGATLCVR